MDIPNLSSNPTSSPISTSSPATQNKSLISLTVVVVVLILAIAVGFWSSKIFPFSKSNNGTGLLNQEKAISTDNIKDKGEIQVGKLYGDTATSFKDSATGTIEKGSINGVGTHILNREGGISQRASLTSSVVDLDLFVGHKVELKGETNSSKQTSWLLDVGSVKVLE
ncbi:MAG: hypothetical protein WC503_00135 [Candidatus Shapirobacteria bacterium]